MELKDREACPGYKAPRTNFQLSDFHITGRIGDGSFSTVILGKHKESGCLYAIKIVNKHLVLRNKIVEYIKNERKILDQLNYDGIIKLNFTFQDADSLYFGLEYCPGGDLYDQIKKRGGMQESDARFYAAEIVLMLKYLRSKEIVHRDMKPENFLLDEQGHLKLIDFGCAKALSLPQVEPTGTKQRTTSFVGTAEYLSPEVLQNLPLSYPADLWALGCIIFQLLVGKPPFKAGSEYLTFQKVMDRDFEFPENFPRKAMDLVDKLLVVDAEKRLGATDIKEVMEHEFFEGIDWENLRSCKAPEFIMPDVPSPEDEALDWELSSLVRAKMPHGGVEYDKGTSPPQETTVSYERNPAAAGNEDDSD